MNVVKEIKRYPKLRDAFPFLVVAEHTGKIEALNNIKRLGHTGLVEFHRYVKRFPNSAEYVKLMNSLYIVTVIMSVGREGTDYFVKTTGPTYIFEAPTLLEYNRALLTEPITILSKDQVKNILTYLINQMGETKSGSPRFPSREELLEISNTTQTPDRRAFQMPPFHRRDLINALIKTRENVSHYLDSSEYVFVNRQQADNIFYIVPLIQG